MWTYGSSRAHRSARDVTQGASRTGQVATGHVAMSTTTCAPSRNHLARAEPLWRVAGCHNATGDISANAAPCGSSQTAIRRPSGSAVGGKAEPPAARTFATA